MSDYASPVFQGWRENGSQPNAKTSEHLTLPPTLELELGLAAITLESSVPDKKWVSRSKRGVPHFHTGHKTNALSEEVNTKVCKWLEDLHITAHGFTLFPKLPAELRLRIWRFALPGQRLVEIKPDTIVKENSSALSLLGFGYQETKIENVRSPAQIPAMLHACVESRTEMLNHYKVTFGGRRFRGWEPRVYFDASVDILFMNCHGFHTFNFIDFLSVFEKHGTLSGLDTVLTLAICTGMAENLASHNSRKDNHRCVNMPALKRLVCVSHGHHSLKSDILVPASDAQPTLLKQEDIEAVENLFGLKLEFGVSKDMNCEKVSTILCLLLEILLTY